MAEAPWATVVEDCSVDEIQRRVTHLEPGDGEKVRIEKELVPMLPPRFEEDYPANAMQEDGAIASYRSSEEDDLVHIIEYEEYWEVHLDEFNPKHDPIKHLINDAPGEALLVGIVLIAVGRKYFGE